MSERTAFAVVNKRGKVVEYTSRIPYQYGQVFYKGDIYQLKNPLPGMKAKRIIMLGTGYPVTNVKAIMKGPKKVKVVVPSYDDFIANSVLDDRMKSWEKQATMIKRFMIEDEKKTPKQKKAEKIEIAVWKHGYVPTPEEQQLLDEVGPIFFAKDK